MPSPLATLLATVLSLGVACGSNSVVTPAPAQGDVDLITLTYGAGIPVTVAIVRPDGYSDTGSHPLVLALPWGQGTTNLALGMIDAYWDAEASARGYIVVSPAIRGTTLETEADLFLPVLFAWMDANLSYDADRVALVGASNGGRGIFHALVSDPGRFSALIGMPGSFTGSVDDLVPFAGKSAWLMVGENDTGWRTATDDTKLALDAAGIPTLLEVLPGQGHVLSVSQSTLMDWIDQALASQ
jgi:hypothetical protein